MLCKHCSRIARTLCYQHCFVTNPKTAPHGSLKKIDSVWARFNTNSCLRSYTTEIWEWGIIQNLVVVCGTKSRLLSWIMDSQVVGTVWWRYFVLLSVPQLFSLGKFFFLYCILRWISSSIQTSVHDTTHGDRLIWVFIFYCHWVLLCDNKISPPSLYKCIFCVSCHFCLRSRKSFKGDSFCILFFWKSLHLGRSLW